MANKTYKGSCHCGAVRYEADLDLAQGVGECNCTICTKLAAAGTRCKPEQLRVTQGEDTLHTYEWGGKIMKRYFCPACGVHMFSRGYLEVMGGAFASVNTNTLDDIDPSTLEVRYWDGRHNNWQAGMRERPWPIAVTTLGM